MQPIEKRNRQPAQESTNNEFLDDDVAVDGDNGSDEREQTLKRQCHPLRIRSAHNKPIFGICRKRSESQHSDYKNVHIFTFSPAEKTK
jgi:hypothetical protein